MTEAKTPATPYAWLVFALTMGLLISDYMARQVLNAVFPLLQAEWALTDAQLGLLSGVVAVMVGLLTFPLSLAADRFGRVKSIAAMAVLWSLATLLCGLAANYQQMLLGRVLVGVGEAAYGSVGIAVVISVFPRHMRATLSAAFMAGALVGQVLGVGLGGALAASYGWRAAFTGIGVGGLLLAILYPWLVKESRLVEADSDRSKFEFPGLGSVFAGASLRLTYVASGLQLFVAGALPAWLPTFFVRYYELPLRQATSLAALFLAICGIGMIVCGALSDRLSAKSSRSIDLAALYCVGCALLLTMAFTLGPGMPQLVLLGGAMFLAAASAGPAGATVANLTPAPVHGTAFATLTLANNLFGLAPGPIVIGWLADRVELIGALRWLPIASIAAALVFLIAARSSQLQHARAKAA